MSATCQIRCCSSPYALRGRTRRRQRALHPEQVGDQLVRRAVGEVGVAGAGSPDPVSGEQDGAAMRLAHCRPRDQPGRLRLRCGRLVEGAGELRAGGQQLGVLAQAPPDPGGGVLQRPQHVVGLDLHRLAGDGRRDVRVAVAVATDPRPEHQVRRGAGRLGGRRYRGPARSRGRGWARAGTTSRRTPPSWCGPRRAGRACCGAAARCATASRSPRGPDGRRRPARSRRAAGRRCAVELVGDPVQRGDDGAAPGLGRVGGEAPDGSRRSSSSGRVDRGRGRR